MAQSTPMRHIALCSLAVLFNGCASTHGLQPVATPRRADSLAAEHTFADATLRTDAWPGRDWWTAYADPQLDQLIREGLRDSPSLKIAAARTRSAPPL